MLKCFCALNWHPRWHKCTRLPFIEALSFSQSFKLLLNQAFINNVVLHYYNTWSKSEGSSQHSNLILRRIFSKFLFPQPLAEHWLCTKPLKIFIILGI